MNRKKALITIAASGLVAAMALGGSLAYLTDNESHTNNVLTSGNIRIDLVEEHWSTTDTNSNGVPDAAEETVPNQEILKDPKIINTGENPVFVFMRVTVPVKDVTRVSDRGQLIRKDQQSNPVVAGSKIFHEPQELFIFKSTGDAPASHINHFHDKSGNHTTENNDHWVRLRDGNTTSREYNTEIDDNGTFQTGTKVGQAVYVFGWENVLPPNGQTTGTLFDKIQLKNIIEFEVQPEQIQNIKLEAFGIQADNVLQSTGQPFPTNTALTKAQLFELYDIFLLQNGHVDETKLTETTNNNGDFIWDTYQDTEHGQSQKEADISNERDLINDRNNDQATTFQNNSVKVGVGNSNQSPYLKVGETRNLTATVQSYKNGASTGVTWTNSNPEVVSLNTANGTITGLKAGDATITAHAEGGANASVAIHVVNDSRDPGPDTNVDINDANNDPIGTTQP
jgi:predicted ribosomally synthesized peptide with SipW-like signal peptide